MDVRFKINDVKFKFRVSAIIVEDGKLLLEKYGEDRYCLPGGTVNINETSENAICRETNEEIGFDFNIEKLAGVTEEFFVNCRGDKTHAINFYYKMNFKNKKDINSIDYDRIEDDHGVIINHHFKWFALNEVESINLVPAQIKKPIVDGTNNFHYVIDDN